VIRFAEILTTLKTYLIVNILVSKGQTRLKQPDNITTLDCLFIELLHCLFVCFTVTFIADIVSFAD
jgi:hypothetical protein